MYIRILKSGVRLPIDLFLYLIIGLASFTHPTSIKDFWSDSDCTGDQTLLWSAQVVLGNCSGSNSKIASVTYIKD